MRDPIRVGHYELLEPIGEGGMGIVYRARDPRLDRIVAIKFLSGAASLDPSRRARFLREARAEAALAHPNIATVLDVGETVLDHPSLSPTSSGWGETALPKIPYLVLEYVPGTDLRTRLRQGPLPPVEALRIARQIAAGLAAAHAAGIVHRDLKPANVRLTPDGLVKILDFGLARFLERQTGSGDDVTELSTREGSVMGTLPYMAPEQAAGQTVDARADLFAFGVMLFEMVTGRRPFHGETTMALLRAVLSEPADRIDPAAVGCSPRYAKLVEALLAKEPDQRPGSARAAIDELEQIGFDHREERTSVWNISALSLELSRIVTGQRRAPRVRAWAVLALVAAVVMTIFWWRSRPAPPSGEVEPTSLQQVAVLPFFNATGDSQLAYVADGLGSPVVGRLAVVPGLSVAAQSETRKFRDGAYAGARDVARELGVGAILEGTLRADGTRIALDATLTDGTTGRVYWARTFVTDRDQLVSLSTELSAGAAAALSVPLSAEDRARLARDPTGSAMAFDYYLRGLSAMEDESDPQHDRIAAGLFARAAELDPAFALAQAGAAEALTHAWHVERDPELIRQARSFASSALELAPDLVEPRLAMARLQILEGAPGDAVQLLQPMIERQRAADLVHQVLAEAWDAAGEMEQCEKHLLAAVASRPAYWKHWNALGAHRNRSGNYAGARTAWEKAAGLAGATTTVPAENLASLLFNEGRVEEALVAYERITRPMSDATSVSNLGTIYFFTDRLSDAERMFRRAIRLEPRQARWRRNLADTLLRIGQPEEARLEYAKALGLVDEQLKVTPGDTVLRLQRTLYLARTGRCVDALASSDALLTELGPTAQVLHQLARPPALCGRPDQAIERLRAGVELGLTPESLAAEDELAALRELPEFRALVDSGAR